MGRTYGRVWAASGLAAALVAAGGSAAAAQDQASGAAPDSMFVQMAASGGLAEVQLGKMAQRQAGSAEVKRFGQRMVTDHSAANKQLISAAQSSGMTAPTTLLPKHQRSADKLSKLAGTTFDAAYMSMMVKDHTEDVQLFQRESQSGRAEALRQVASQTLPTLQEHLRAAKELAGKVGADTTGAAASTDAHAEHQSASGH